uniref:Surface antigen 2 n=2 Tax=Sarcocystis neurona TaxID=42890 RepID=Q86PQ2_SARNE|nr:surface antigen 2 [Sarcocystis neurona]ACU82377.1 surface antigen 2 [Sarcocystis neurona]ADG26775.1 surface antigen 2 [Sarcocystis neurona]WME00808.1 surface antigen 2 [Sarcocystis neurona]
METPRCILACAAGIAAVIICSSFSVASAQVATIACTQAGMTPVSLGPGQSFVLNCQAPFTIATPANFHTHACAGTGANCQNPETYAKLFPKASNHVWVSPADSTSATHTWTAPAANQLSGKTVFSVGCTSTGDPAGICAVDVTVSSSVKTVASGVLLAMCSLASLTVL